MNSLRLPAVSLLSAIVLLAACGDRLESTPPPPAMMGAPVLDSFVATTSAGIEGHGPRNPVDSTKSDFATMNIAFNTPDSILVGESKTVELVIDSRKIGTGTIDNLKHVNSGTDSVFVDSAKLTRKIRAKLIGDFDIVSANTSGEQLILDDSPTVMSWQVKATSPGAKSLVLTIASVIEKNGKVDEHALPGYKRNLLVVVPEVSIGQKVSDFFFREWKWLWSAILVPVVGFLWARFRRKTEK